MMRFNLFFLNSAGTVLSETELVTLNKIAKVNKDIILVLVIDAAEDIPTHKICKTTQF